VLDYILHTAPDGIKLNTDRATDEQDEYKSTKVSVSHSNKHVQETFPILDCKRERFVVPAANNVQMAISCSSPLYHDCRKTKFNRRIESAVLFL
jgi:hypothetical protein